MATRKQLVDRWKREPGATIAAKILAWVVAQAERQWRNPDAGELYALLDGLPYRDEVSSGRDLRGSDFDGALNLDLRDADLSYCRRISELVDCDVRGARLDGARGFHSLEGTFAEASFRKAQLQSVYGGGARFDRCDFSGSRLKNAHMKGADFRGSVFDGADLEGADLQRCDLRGCSFREARLDFALFGEVRLDETTDLRGASLVELACEERRDFSGKLVMGATDWRRATWDETARFGAAPGAEDAALLGAIAKAAARQAAPWASSVRDEARRLKKVVRADPDLDWLEALSGVVPPSDRAAFDAFLERATLNFGA